MSEPCQSHVKDKLLSLCDGQYCSLILILTWLDLNWHFLAHCVSVCPSQAGESVLSALGGCKMLRELSKLESETENKLAMKELAKKFENLAHGESDHKLLCLPHICSSD